MQFTLSAPFSSDIELANSELTLRLRFIGKVGSGMCGLFSFQNPTRTHRTDVTEPVAQ